MKTRVYVTLKNGVLDPQGKAIHHALEGLGFGGVNDVRAGKMIELDLDPGVTDAEVEAGGKLGLAVPDHDRRLAADVADRHREVAVAIGAGEDDDGAFHGSVLGGVRRRRARCGNSR